MLSREGSELFYEPALSIGQAALGTTINVPTRDGEEAVEVRPGTAADTEIRLRGKGVPHLRRAGARGDLHVLVDVRVPTGSRQEAARVCSRRSRPRDPLARPR